jgi:hypothetical protein
MSFNSRSELIQTDIHSSDEMKCKIWAVTAMNESEVQMHVHKGLLDGMTVKPLSLKQVENIVIQCDIQYYKNDAE